MLARLELKNFRCFADHSVEFPRHTLLVGKNNAGKSTCVEGLRLISLVTERMKNLPLKSPPREFELPLRYKGFRPSISSIFVHKECLFHRYSDPPARVTAYFTNGSKLEVHVGDEMLLHAIVFDAQGKPATSREAVNAAEIPRVSILPQISPLSMEESRLNDDYIRSNIQTLRSSLHFRNQLRLLQEHFADFRQRVSVTWPGLQIISLELPDLLDTDGRISLLVRDGDFTAEVAWMGHGLQMWLQTMWFLCRNDESSVLILDEPDVYMHADLQRKLIRMLLRDDRQFIVATHSPEMLAEVEPDSVVVLNRNLKVSKSAASVEAVQKLLFHVGSVHNLSLARLGIFNRILLVEGQDVPILKLFQNALNPSSSQPLDALPNSDIEGWSKWPAVLTMAKFFRKNGIKELQVFCVLDRDYRDDGEIRERLEEAKENGVFLTVWSAKEIENYAIKSAPIARLVSQKIRKNVDCSRVQKFIQDAIGSLRDETIDDYSEAIRVKDRSGANKSNPLARRIVEERWNALGGEMVVSGKKLFSKIAKWCQDEYKVSITLPAILRVMVADEVHADVSKFIESVTGEINFR